MQSANSKGRGIHARTVGDSVETGAVGDGRPTGHGSCRPARRRVTQDARATGHTLLEHVVGGGWMDGT
jgi:hypothetical protein